MLTDSKPNKINGGKATFANIETIGYIEIGTQK
jgi:hypothetical protein